MAALGRALDADLLSAAAAVPPPHALGQLAAYFADPAGLCREATADFVGAVQRHDAAVRTHLEAAAAEVGTEERVLRENTRPGALVFVVSGALFALAALALAALGMPGLSTAEARLVAAVALSLGALMGGFGLFKLRRPERVTLILRPEALVVPGCDRPISWDDVADLDITVNQTGLATRLLLPPEAPFPKKVPGGRGLKLDAKRRIVTIALGLPRKMRPQDFADLIGRYRLAAEARRTLSGANPTVARPLVHEIEPA